MSVESDQSLHAASQHPSGSINETAETISLLEQTSTPD